jgi:hypothetical protein
MPFTFSLRNRLYLFKRKFRFGLMELRQFISATLLDIVGAVKDAQEKSDPGTIVPDVASTFQSVEAGIHELQAIEFEVTVNVGERSGTETKINVVAAFLGGSTKAGSDKAGGHAATLKFKIPICLPKKG